MGDFHDERQHFFNGPAAEPKPAKLPASAPTSLPDDDADLREARSVPGLPEALHPGAGHRDRLRARFARAGPGALEDYELLELFLFRTIPRRDTKPVAKALLARFGDLGQVLGAEPHQLMEIKGVGASVALDLKVIAAAARHLVRTGLNGREVLSSWQSVIDYCTAAMAHEKREQLRLLFLDKKNKLIVDEVQQTGTVDHTPVYVREVMERALQVGATAIVVVHNHPSGDPSPSRADIEMTKELVSAGERLGIVIHDHIVIGRDGHNSLRGLGYI